MKKKKPKKKVPKDVIEKVQSFLEERRESDGGFAPVTSHDMDLLHNVIGALLEKKWSLDPDGDLPINYILIDRTKYWPMHYAPVPYAHNGCTVEEERWALREKLSNLKTATEDVDMHLRLEGIRSRKDETTKTST